MTFSIVARDPRNGDVGVAVASKFLAVGALVPWVQAGAGAVATQSYVNPAFGPVGLTRFHSGMGATEVSAQFQREDAGIAQRQYGLVDAAGHSATYTGPECHAWAGGVARPDVAIQGNILTGPEVVDAMLAAWQDSAGLALPARLLGALRAGDDAGGDRRGRQSAALRCAGPGRGYGGLSDDWVDLRVDDHPQPCQELARLLEIHDLLFGRPLQTRPLTPAELTWLRGLLVRRGYAPHLPDGPWDAATEQAAWALYGTENLEERWVTGGQVDPVALAYLQRQNSAAHG